MIKTYLLAMSFSTQKHFIYPARFFIWMLGDIARMIIMPFLWLALYGAREEVVGFSRADIVSYYLVITLVSFFSISHASGYIFNDIMKGKVHMFLLKPYSYLFFSFMSENGYKIISGCLGIGAFVALSFFAPSYIVLPREWSAIFFFGMFLLIARVLSFSFEVIVGLSSFWFGRIGAANHFRFLMEQVFGGEMAPLIFFPLMIQTIAAWLPFQYLFYIPTQVFLGHLSHDMLLRAGGIGLLWVGFFLGCIWLLWRRGIRIYEGAGM